MDGRVDLLGSILLNSNVHHLVGFQQSCEFRRNQELDVVAVEFQCHVLVKLQPNFAARRFAIRGNDSDR